MIASVSGRCNLLHKQQHQHQQQYLHQQPQAVAGSHAPLRALRRASPSNDGRTSSSSSSSSRLVRAYAGGVPPLGETVGDVMNPSKISCSVSTTVDEALELLVNNRVSGLPVVDKDGVVIGVVSDFDLLPLEAVPIGGPVMHPDIFPEVGTEWKAFNDLAAAMAKNSAKSVADVMTPDPLVVRPFTGLVDAAQILLKSRVRRLPVVDAQGKLAGVISRSAVIKAALSHRRQANPA